MLAKPEYFSPPNEVCCWPGLASGKLAGWGAVAKSHREDAAGRGAVAELLVRAAGGNSWLGRPDRAATGRGAAAKSYREAVAGRGAAAKIHREESAMAKVPGRYVKFGKECTFAA